MPDCSLSGRKLVFLQGPSSRFFGHLARACKGLGGTVMRVGVAPADRLFWPAGVGRYVPYRGRSDGFEAFMADLIAREAPTDLVMLGDGRTHHAQAIAAARAAAGGPTPWIVELGYLRPDLLIVERWGTGGRSDIPDAFARSARETESFTQPERRWAASFVRNSVQDVTTNIANYLTSRVLYPGYRHYATDSVPKEYSGWIVKGLTRGVRRRAARQALDRIAGATVPLWLVPLQLDTDFQLRHHGTGEPQVETLRRVVASFAAHAAREAALIVKQHPLDNGWARWPARVADIARETGIGGRVIFLDGGAVEPMFPRISGVVTINSTVGLSALAADTPVKVLGRAIYDLPGLTHQGALDTFWNAPEAPDRATRERFLGFIQRRYHVPGAFDGPGAVEGARNVARRLAEGIPE